MGTKKEYIRPHQRCYAVRPMSILNGSQTGQGYTGQQYARPANVYDPFGNFDEEQ